MKRRFVRVTLRDFFSRYGNPVEYYTYYRGGLITKIQEAGRFNNLYRIWLDNSRESKVISLDAVLEVAHED